MKPSQSFKDTITSYDASEHPSVARRKLNICNSVYYWNIPRKVLVSGSVHEVGCVQSIALGATSCENTSEFGRQYFCFCLHPHSTLGLLARVRDRYLRISLR